MVINAESGISGNENLADELHKRVIRKLKKKKKKKKEKSMRDLKIIFGQQTELKWIIVF